MAAKLASSTICDEANDFVISIRKLTMRYLTLIYTSSDAARFASHFWHPNTAGLPKAISPVAVRQSRDHHTAPCRGMHEATLVHIYTDMAHGRADFEEHQIAAAQIIGAYAAAQRGLFVDGTRQALVEQRLKGNEYEARAIDAVRRHPAQAIRCASP